MTGPLTAGELMDELRYCEDALRAIRAVIATQRTKEALGSVIDRLKASRTSIPRIVSKAAPDGRRPSPRGAVAATRDRQFTSEESKYPGKNDAIRGLRHCPRHDGGDGAWLPIEQFDLKSPTAPQLRFCCRDCWRAYQRERYVSANKRAIIVEVRGGDEIIGATCNGCGKPFEIGDLVRGSRLTHDGCGDAEA